jgi:hypothetical protein
MKKRIIDHNFIGAGFPGNLIGHPIVNAKGYLCAPFKKDF